MAFSGIYNSYNNLWKAIVSPPKQDYSTYSLGPNEFNLKGNQIQRTDLTLTNKKNINLACSFFFHTKVTTPMPCVIYLHANGCTRCEAMEFVTPIMSNGINVFCFDFPGCGKSEGEYTSLGHFEQDDLDQIIQYLKGTGKVSKIAIWGRSMGAVTALLHASRDPSKRAAECMILDSSFASFKRLFKEQAKKKASIPGFVSEGAYSVLKMTIKDKVGFDVDMLKPLKVASKVTVPALFGASKEDALVHYEHTEDLCKAYGGPKKLILFEGGHNSRRPANWINEAISFLRMHLFDDKEQSISKGAYISPTHSQVNEEFQYKAQVKELNISQSKLQNYKGTPQISSSQAAINFSKGFNPNSTNTSVIISDASTSGESTPQPGHHFKSAYNSPVTKTRREMYHHSHSLNQNHSKNLLNLTKIAAPSKESSPHYYPKETHIRSGTISVSGITPIPLTQESPRRRKIESFTSAVYQANPNVGHSNNASPSHLVRQNITGQEQSLPQSRYIISSPHGPQKQIWPLNQGNPTYNPPSSTKNENLHCQSYREPVSTNFAQVVQTTQNEQRTSSPSKQKLGNMMQKMDMNLIQKVDIKLMRPEQMSPPKKVINNTFDANVPTRLPQEISTHRGENHNKSTYINENNKSQYGNNSFQSHPALKYRHSVSKLGVVESKKVYVGIPLDQVKEAFSYRRPI